MCFLLSQNNNQTNKQSNKAIQQNIIRTMNICLLYQTYYLPGVMHWGISKWTGIFFDTIINLYVYPLTNVHL